MLDMGFEEPIREIVGKTPKSRQTLLFSATFPEAMREISRGMLRDPVEVTVEGGERHARRSTSASTRSTRRARRRCWRRCCCSSEPESCVVFCNMRRDVDEVAGSLAHYGFTALALHGDMEQRDRDEVLVRFANRSCNVLVASDVAARGLDVKELAMVVNYDVPSDADTYVHRIGRTGRAGSDGLALSLCTPRERRACQRHRGAPGHAAALVQGRRR